MKRGDIVLANGRPFLVMQHDAYSGTARVAVLGITTRLVDAPMLRLPILPDEMNGLKAPSQIALDYIAAVPRNHVAEVAGRLDAATLRQVDRHLATFLGIVT